MKQIVFFVLFFSFITGMSNAQTNTPEKELISPFAYDREYMNPMPPDTRNISKTTKIDSGFIRVLYALNAVDITKPETYDDLQRLEIGSLYSKYYSLYVFNRDSSITSDLIQYNSKNNTNYDLSDDGQMHITMLIDGKFQGWSEYLFSEFFKDFSKNELTEYARMPYGLWKYNSQYSEPLPIQNWKTSDDTLTIAGYLCQKATCRFRGRNYTAWFTTDIPISNGPWKFGGLPGLILKVYDDKKLYVYECVGIENHKQKYSITRLDAYKRYLKTDRIKLSKLKKAAQENHYQMVGLTPEKDRVFPKLYPYNPLELE